MNRRHILAALAVAPLAACGANAVTTAGATATAGLGSANTILGNIVKDWGIAKGIAQIAVQFASASLPPGAATIILAAIAVGDSLFATAQSLLDAGTADVATATSVATQLQAQAQALRLTAAPAIKVVAG